MSAVMPIMNPNLKDFWLTRSRGKVLFGGRDSSKSWDTAAHSVRIANELPLRFLCTRMYQNRIEESVYTLIKKQIWRFGFAKDYRILNTKIIQVNTGAEFIFYGLARNIDEIKSAEGIDVLWIEEAHSLTEEMWDQLEPTLRKEGSEIWIIFNPRYATDFAYKRFILNPPDNFIIRKINYDENPFLSNTSKETIERRKSEDFDSYLHIYEGIPKQDDEEVIIKRIWLDACVDAHLKLGIEPKGIKRIGYDVADDGRDLNATVNRYGFLVNNIQQWKAGEHELFNSSARVRKKAIQLGSSVFYDGHGLGAGTGSNIKKLNTEDDFEVEYEPFMSGGAVINKEEDYEEGVKNKDYFKNLKSQTWKMLADRALHTYNAINGEIDPDESKLLSFSSECDYLEQLLTELSLPRKDYDGNGLLMVEGKKPLKKRGVESPNIADACIIAFSPETKNYQPQTASINI